MEVEEARKILEVSPEEESIVRKYLGFMYANVNILGTLDMHTYNRVSTMGGGRKVPENAEELQDAIEQFVKIYEVMYKESKGQKINTVLRRGANTSYDNSHFLSTSRSVEVAKRFCPADYGVLSNFYVEAGVPFLDTAKYREQSSADEQEVILAPFCKISKKNDYVHYYNGFPEYDMKIEKADLPEISQEELDRLHRELIDGFEQNVSDIKEGGRLEEALRFKGEEGDRPEDCGNSFDFMRRLAERQLSEAELAYRKAVYYKEDERRQESCLAEVEFLKEKVAKITAQEKDARKRVGEIISSTSVFSKNLRRLLEGMCKQKELEIDRAFETVQKQEMISEFSNKLPEAGANADIIQSSVSKTYQDLLDSEKNLKSLAAALGIPFTRTISSTGINRSVEEVKSNINNIKELIDGTELKSDSSMSDVSKTYDQLDPLLTGIGESLGDTESFGDIVKMYNIQGDRDIKKGLYEKVHNAIQSAKIAKYTQEKEALQNKKIGFLGRLRGKDVLRDAQIKNLELKIKLAQKEPAKEQDNYSARDMLADMYVYGITELGGNLTPEMNSICRDIKAVYRDRSNGTFTEEYITGLANQKIQAERRNNLPIAKAKRQTFFGKSRAMAEALTQENSTLQSEIANLSRRETWRLDNQEPDALSIFDQKLKAIAVRTHDKTQDRELPNLESSREEPGE